MCCRVHVLLQLSSDTMTKDSNGKGKGKAMTTPLKTRDASVKETWKPTHVTHLYEVSNLGRVRRADNQFVRKLTTNPHGYNLLTLNICGKPFTNLVGRLVLGAFDRAPIDGDKAHHIDGNSTNDMIENLEWTSIGEAGTTRSYPRSIASKPVVATSEDRKERMVFVSALEAASLFDTRRADIYDAIKYGRSISDGVCGYTFDYDDSDKPVCEERSVPGSDVYMVSRDGRVRMENGRWTFGSRHWQTTGDSKKDKQAYRRVDMTLTTGGTSKTKKKYVHVVVAEAFLGECPAGYQVDHIDGNKSNNAVSNLEYVSKRENDRRTYANGGRKPPGEKPVLLIKQDGTFSRFKSSSEGARQMGVNVATVSINCSTGRKNRAGNYWAHDKPVVKYGGDEFESLSKASGDTGESIMSILMSCRNTDDESWTFVE
ncbi:unnamed protein product [Ectocarpus sp. 4 AP-2014]|uniref:EsV-1-119 n=1 Tax=Ectocarpus siliculosus virus 1 (isolate New Zealand/Kaikoura/1988) TaxID=654926 RepID=Q8QNG0_ESV1K|nr:HNH endonuclease [Ectocarpus siliculosus virus 1]AAK14537.1 EsV-1-119 [Ectocarpus siliculosus virus 1]